MNINKYKSAMEEIDIDTHKIRSGFENTLYQKNKDKNISHLAIVKKPLLICIASFLLIAVLISTNLLTDGNSSDFSLTVYASDVNKELDLSDTSVTLSASNQFNMQGITNNETGTVNFDLKLKCEGNNIESITYKLSDEIITKENRGRSVAWFVENDSFLISDSLVKSDKSPFETYKEDENVYEIYRDDTKYYLTRMVGSAYSVDYENQQNKNYAIAISFQKDNKGDFIAEDFTITVTISLNDGSSLERYIEVKPVIGNILNDYKSDDLSKIQMTLKD